MGLILWGSLYVYIILLMNYFQETILFSSSLFLNHSIFYLQIEYNSFICRLWYLTDAGLSHIQIIQQN